MCPSKEEQGKIINESNLDEFIESSLIEETSLDKNIVNRLYIKMLGKD